MEFEMAESSKRQRLRGSFSTAGERRRRQPSPTKNSPSPSSPPSPTAPHQNLQFSTPAVAQRYFSLYKDRQIIEPKCLNDEYFESRNFEFFGMLKNLGLDEFCCDVAPYNSDLVRVFYSNLKICENGTMKTEVNNVQIIIKLSIFASIANLPSVGLKFEGKLFENWANEYNIYVVRQLICLPHNPPTTRILADNMTAEARVLHYTICRVLFPRVSNFAQATEEDLLIMWIIMTTKQINWTHLIRHRMKKALRPGAPLPYPTLVTRILEHFEVPLEDEISVPPSRHCTISGGVIQSFGLTQNADNRWVHRNSPPPHQHQNQPPPQLQPQPRLQQQTSSLHDVLRGINDLRTFVGDSFNTLNESINARFEQLELNMGDRFDTIDARVEHVEHDIDYLRRHFDPHGGSSS
ncbi:hypothetical protein LR48_Vigan10g243200 [Vigna angularis]|uniref:Putative plant transposon protein domain-containing protein n=1 Tax=Phaseolus angularis TaxID=3914 RepID=A0A0L9VNB2_PHAAN|nr:hypothetical protein LR48_Vigan10g243200 [Vigna angularis]